MSGLKIALICDHFLPRIGGLELQVRDLALALKRAGQEPWILTTTPGESVVEGIPVHRIPASLMVGFKIIWTPGALFHLEKFLQKENFDVVHSHSSVISPLAYGSLWVTKKLNIPTLITCHSLLQYSSYTFSLFNKILRWNRGPLLLSAVSRASALGVQRAGGTSSVSILPNGIDPLDWKVSRTLGSSIEITSVLRLNKKKRGQDLVRAIPEILKKLPSSLEVKFNIIGKGPYQKRIHYLVRRLGLKNKVKLWGYLPRGEIKKIFARTSFFVLPTVKEAFGIAVLEAQCAGLPVVAMNHGGTSDIIQHGRNGFLSNTKKEFISNVVQLILNPKLRDNMAEQTQKKLEKFSWKNITAEHMKVYASAIAKRETGTPTENHP